LPTKNYQTIYDFCDKISISHDCVGIGGFY
jgi:hypothetical protein